MFSAIAKQEYSRLREIGERHLNHHDGIVPIVPGILCLDHVFCMPWSIERASSASVYKLLRLFSMFLKNFLPIALNPDAHFERNDVQRLFGISIFDGFVFADATSLLGRHDAIGSIISENGKIKFSRKRANNLLVDILRRRLSDRVQTLNAACSGARELSAYCPASLYGDCGGGDCLRIHLKPSICDRSWFHRKIDLILQQILVLNLSSSLFDKGKLAQWRYAPLTIFLHASSTI